MPDPLEPGDPERIGEFWPAGRLGAGGQGVVYDAYAPDGTRVAVKVLHGAQESPKELQAMAAEARAAQRVASFCTARILQVRLEPPRPYIVSEYIDGLSLQAVVRGTADRDGRLFTGDDLHRLGIGIATALTAIHRAKVVHRDLKPGNVLLGPDGPRLIDFGIARVLDTRSADAGTFAGTLPYMAPEVYAGRQAGAEADVFAWGAIMLFAATGEHAFKGLALPEIAHRVRTHEPDLDVLPETLRPLVGAALAKEPLARPSATEILTALTGDPRDGSDLVAAGAAQAVLEARWEPGDPALGKVAEDAYAALPPAVQRLVPELFLRFVVPGEDGGLTTRPIPEDELFDRQDDAEAQTLRDVVQAFGRLLLMSGGQFVLTRPALLRAWPRLRGWVEAERDGLRTHHRIRQAARTWAEHGRRRADVLTGAHMDEAVRWATSGARRPALSRLERDLLDASARARYAHKRRNRAIAGVLAVTAVVALGATGWAVDAQRTRSEERDIAASQQLAAQSRQFAGAPETAALLAVAAQRVHETPESRAALLDVVTRSGRGAVAGYGPNPITVAAGGGRLAFGNDDGTVAVWDVKARKQIGAPLRLLPDADYRDDLVLPVALSPDGRVLAAAGSRGNPSEAPGAAGDVVRGTVRLWDVTTGKPLGDLPVAHASSVTFSPDGKTLTVIGADGVTVWDAQTRRRTRLVPFPPSFTYQPRSHEGSKAALSADTGTAVFALPGALEIWDVHAGHRKGTIPGPIDEVALSRDGRTIAARHNKTIRLRDTGSGRTIGTRIPMKTEYVQRPLFTPDGKTLLIGTDMWDVARGVRAGAISGTGQEQVLAGAFTDEWTLVTVSGVAGLSDSKNAVRLWDTKVHQPLPGPFVPVEKADEVILPAASGDGRVLAVAHAPGGAGIAYASYSAATGGRVAGPVGPPPNLADILGTAMAVSADGKSIASGNTYGQISVWSGGRWAGPFEGGPGSMLNVMAFSPDGRTLATGGGAQTQISTPVVDGKVQLWDARTGRMLAVLGDSSQQVASLAFSPDGRTLAAGMGAAVHLFDTASRRDLGVLDNPSGSATALAFSRDGRTLATGGNGAVSLWDVRTRQSRGAPISGHNGQVTSAAFDASGRTLATGGADGTALLWDVASHRQLGSPLTGHTKAVTAVAFDAGDKTLMTTDGAAVLRHWNIAMPANATGAACAIAGRSLTRKEWTKYVPSGVPYRAICPTSR
ncbi:protein kinase domain-containing protein [Actinomadura geliboluensis]|uniref:protein kinase domain-containing protein n=1 Tax=Actinomadura geliboluensis TaxID=882440 RepID=UPI0036C0CDB2